MFTGNVFHKLYDSAAMLFSDEIGIVTDEKQTPKYFRAVLEGIDAIAKHSFVNDRIEIGMVQIWLTAGNSCSPSI